MPTVLSYFGIDLPKQVRGQSLWPYIRGEVAQEKVALIEHAGHNQVALRSDRFKYIRHLRTANLQPSYPFTEGREELYDLSEDPRETIHLIDSKKDVARIFRKELERRRAQRLALQIGKAELNEETVEVLRALGYVR